MVKIICTLLTLLSFSLSSAQEFQQDKYDLGNDQALIISFIGHGSLLFEIGDQVIHIDPSSREADYDQLPKADLVLITHHHGDHCDASAVEKVKGDKTQIITTQLAADKLKEGTVLPIGQTTDFSTFTVEALPAYNLVHKRDNGDFFHPKGTCNSYVLTVGNKRIFIGGDTENTPEMKALKNIDIAFLPMNLPYTMTPEMVADAAKAFKPKILYPYHYGKTDTNIIVNLMKDEAEVETIIRDMP